VTQLRGLLTPLKDLLGIGVFSFVQADLRANIGVRTHFPAFRIVRRCPRQSMLTTMQPKQGVRSRHMSHQQVSTTLEKLVTSEVQEGTRQSTACLVRLVRYVSPHYLSQESGPPPDVPFYTPVQWTVVHLSSAGIHASRSHFRAASLLQTII
jgi:hypothetical protein